MNDGTIGTWSYRAGGWFAVFGANTTLLLPESERERVVALWSLVDGGADFTQVLDGLLASGLSTLRGFVLVGADVGPTRILLRGDDVRASLTTAAETVELEGAGATTWVERTVDDVTALVVTVGEESGGPDFPIDGGLVRVSRIDLPPAGAATAGSTEPEPEPGSAPEVEAATVLPVGLEPSPLSADGDTFGTPPPPPPPPPAPADAELPPFAPLAPPDGPPPGPPGPPPEGPPDTPDFLQPWPEAGEPEAGEPEAGEPEEPAPAAVDLDDDPVTEQMPAVPPPPPPGSTPSIGDLPITPPPPPPVPADDGDIDSDHDGLTQAGASATDEFAREQPGIPGQPMAPSVTRPVAKLIISNGETVDVDRVVLIGRAPEARRFTSTEQPMLVTVPSPMHEISSTHVEVRPGSGADHGSAVVTDMGSTNGTVLVQPGLPPEDLKPGIAVQLIPGAIINLGDGLTIQVARP